MASLRATNDRPEENRRVSLPPLHAAIPEAIRARALMLATEALQRHLDDTEHRQARARRAGRIAG